MHFDVQIRPVDPDDDAALDAYLAQQEIAFTSDEPHTPARRDAYREMLRVHRLTGAYDGDRIVATYRSWDWTLTLPGGAATVRAISSVTVAPTHRRRGLLTALMTGDLAEAHAGGTAAAVLIASEATIYGRFGFGPATETATWHLDVGTARLRPDVPRSGDLEMVPLPALREIAPQVFAAARLPGATDRSPDRWDLLCHVRTIPGRPEKPAAAVVHRDEDGVPQGYVIYTWVDRWEGRVCRTVATVQDFQAATPAAYAALWGLLCELDLIETVRGADRPVDEPLPWLLVDPRAARRVESGDMLWTRLLDPVAALAARRYEASGDVVLAVTDPLGHATGTLSVQVDGTGKAVVGPTTAPPHLTLPVDVLSSIWLGGGDLPAAALAGRVQPHRDGAVEEVARLFRTLRAPWTGTSF